jgi:serine protease AprX
MRAKRNLIASVVFLLAAAFVAPAAVLPATASTAGPTRSVIVQGASEAAVRAAVAAHHGTVTQDLWIVSAVAADIPESELAALRAEPGITQITDNGPVHVQAAHPSPVHSASAVYPKVVGADHLWTEGVDGEGVTVAVVDTGITPVADLAGRVIGGIDFSGGDDPYNDEFGHGTFVAGIIAGNGASSNGAYKGVAPKAKLVSVKIAGRNGASDITNLLAAIQWTVSFRQQYGIRVLNLSVGGTDAIQPYLLSPLNAAVEKAWDAGLVVTVSASNNGDDPGTISKPADDPLVITVGALDDKGTPGQGDDVMAGFSGVGPTAADGLTKPDLVAPGRSVISLRAPGSKVDSSYPGSRVGSAYFKGSGTSFSTAVASGSAALLLQGEPGLTPDQVKARLLGTAAPGPVGNPNVDGHGSLDTYAAAHAGTFDSANQGVTRSVGTGSLQLDRGSLQVQIQTGWILDPIFGLLTPVFKLVLGTLTSQNETFDQVAYFASEWTGNAWYDSQWSGNAWYGNAWYGNAWYGNAWYGNAWYGNAWWGNAWYAAAWE